MSMSPLAQRNLEVVQTMAANGYIGNYDVVAPFIADNYTCNLPEGLAYGGTYHGLEGYKQVFAHISDYFSEVDFSEVEFFPDDHKVAILLRLRATLRNSGRKIDMPLAEFWTLENGKVTNITAFYYDTKTIHQLDEG